MSRLSVIIPHYNSIMLLQNLLDTIPTSKNIQIIVVDDNSTYHLKEYRELKQKEKYSHVNFLKNNTQNKGAGSCRNIGLLQAKGEWILFADSDDYFVDGFYDAIGKFLDSKNDVVFFAPTSIELDTRDISDRHLEFEKLITDYFNEPNRNTELLLRYTFSVPWSKLIRRKFIEKKAIQFSETLAANDVIFSMKVGHMAKMWEASKETIYCVTRSKGTLTTSMSEEIFDERLNIHIEYYKFLQEELSKEEFKIFQLHGSGFMMNAIIYKLGIMKMIKTYMILKEQKIRVLPPDITSIKSFIQRINDRYIKQKTDKKYLVK